MSKSAPIYPASLKQAYMLDQATHPDCPKDLRDFWVLKNAMLVKPGIDLKRVKRAGQKLAARHDNLRLQFFRYKGSWMARIQPKGEEVFREIELGDVSDAVFWKTLLELANAPMDLVEAPLAETVVIRCGKRGDVLLSRIHHTLTDGYGMIVLIEDLIKYIVGLPILGKAASFVDYLKDFHLPSPQKAPAIDAFWEKMHAELPLAPMMGRKAKGLPPLVDDMGEIDLRTKTFKSTIDSMRRFEHQCRTSHQSPETVMTAAYLEALCHLYQLPKVAFMTHAARTEPALSTYAGDHTRDIFLPFTPTGKKDLSKACDRLSEMLQQALMHLPSKAAFRGNAYFNELAARGCFPNQFAVYQARPVNRQKKSEIAAGLFLEFGEEVPFISQTITRLDVNRVGRIISEMVLVLDTAKSPAGFALQYDRIAFDDDEVDAIGQKICELTGLKPTDVVPV